MRKDLEESLKKPKSQKKKSLSSPEKKISPTTVNKVVGKDNDKVATTVSRVAGKNQHLDMPLKIDLI